jgi:hypothetical protein
LPELTPISFGLEATAASLMGVCLEGTKYNQGQFRQNDNIEPMPRFAVVAGNPISTGGMPRLPALPAGRLFRDKQQPYKFPNVVLPELTLILFGLREAVLGVRPAATLRGSCSTIAHRLPAWNAHVFTRV